MTEGQTFAAFFGIWVGVGAVAHVFFSSHRSVELKRRYFPWFAAFACTLFLSFVAIVGAPVSVLICAAAFVAGIAHFNVTNIQFCKECGRTVARYLSLPKAENCPKCGASLR